MSSASLAIVVIACPHCGTRYQVPYGTIGTSGREVQCAHCSKSWHATAAAPHEPEPLPQSAEAIFSPADEAVLDAEFEAEEEKLTPLPRVTAIRDPEHERTLAEIRRAIMPRPKPVPAAPVPQHPLDADQLKTSRKRFERRMRDVEATLPLGKLRRIARISALLTILGLAAILLLFRADIVRTFPSLAGVYSAVGLKTNIVGLEFSDAKTLMTLRNGSQIMQVTATIRAVAPGVSKVPPVLVSLLDVRGTPIYEWTVLSKAQEMVQGDITEISTEVNAPPQGAVRVRLTFTAANPGAR